MKYKVVLTKSEEGLAASVTGLPVCWSQGLDEAEALSNIRDAIGDYLAAVNDQVRGKEVREIDVVV